MPSASAATRHASASIRFDQPDGQSFWLMAAILYLLSMLCCRAAALPCSPAVLLPCCLAALCSADNMRVSCSETINRALANRARRTLFFCSTPMLVYILQVPQYYHLRPHHRGSAARHAPDAVHSTTPASASPLIDTANDAHALPRRCGLSVGSLLRLGAPNQWQHIWHRECTRHS